MVQLSILYVFLGVLCSLLDTAYTQDILGCGGFVKSEVEINFSLVEVALYTKLGSLKYQTDCAPNNGYYMIPVYDKGDYILKVEPPPGWTFEPQSVELQIDGTTDKCSLGEDINFQFTGFGVIGKVVSQGQNVGPGGITLTLYKLNTEEVVKQTLSTDGGSFTFEKVLPGDYTIKATHPTWKLIKDTTQVKVGRETGNAGSTLTVQGYDVEGSVLSDGDPIRGVHFLLFSDVVDPKLKLDCDKGAVAGYPATSARHPLCHVTSQDDGRFLFPSLPHGQYQLVPFYKGEHITFDVVPAKFDFFIEHDSVKIPEPFQVAGFSVRGRVVTSSKGVGVANAHVFLNGKEQVDTSEDGSYHLDSMKAGTYTLHATTTNVFFDEMSIKITPNTPQLPDLIAARFNLCGRVIIDKIPGGLTSAPQQRKISVKSKADSVVSSLNTDKEGTFCSEVKPGTYVLKVELSAAEQAAGLKLAPAEKEVTVLDKPVSGIVFSQFRAKVAGTITCLENCGQIQLSLSAIGRTDDKRFTQAIDDGKKATYVFEDVMPGKYKVSLMHEAWCWKEKSIEVEITDTDLKNVDLKQNGYILSCSLSHDITLSFEQENQPGNVGEFNLTKGISKFCLAQPGVYKLTPHSCHQFQQETYRYDTSSPSVLTLTAVRHQVEGVIITQERKQDIIVTIMSSIEGEGPTVLGPLLSDKEPTPPKNPKEKPAELKGPFTYQFTHWIRSGEHLEVSVASAELLFNPPSVDFSLQTESCPGKIPPFEGRQGIFIEGVIDPALVGVVITITADGDESKQITMETDDQGKYRVGPLHSEYEYSVAAEKEGYVLTPVTANSGNFKAFKLGEISVKVQEESGAALSGVLLSLSGGSQYRSNKVTSEDGAMSFMSLSPGKYFLRPMMKEYKFDPVSKMIDVLEGSTVNLDIKASRVAFSCYGAVTSLNGEPEPEVIVEAVGSGDCKNRQEESKTEVDGSFRIRGLQPKCNYNIRLKTGDVNQHIERTVPPAVNVNVENDDVTDVRIIAFRRFNQMDLSGNVLTKNEFLSHLKIRLFKENSDSPLHTISLGTTSFFYLPSLTIDNQNYFVRLESSLSHSTYDYKTSEINFVANSSYKHFTFTFDPKHKSVEHELTQTSFLVLPLTIIICFLAYNYQKLLPALSQGTSAFQNVLNRPVGTPSHTSSAPIQINPELLGGGDGPAGSKKKPKIRKA